MRAVVIVAMDLLREAYARKWFLALGIGITLVLVTTALALRLDVVDGALAATRLFGEDVDHSIRPADVALRPLFEATSYIIFYGGLVFGVLACADFAPSLLSPGRIEHLLSLPVRRWELLAGTFLGVLMLTAAGCLYGAGGLALIMGVKTGVWTFRPVVSALIAGATFTSLYGTMLTVAVFARSAALSAAFGGGLLVMGIIAGFRAELARLFEPGLWRWVFESVTALVPRVSLIAQESARIAASEPFDPRIVLRLVGGAMIFGLAALVVGVWRFEQRDF